MRPQNSRRAQTKLIISLSPGIHLRRLQKLLDASFTTTRYHVKKLEQDGEVVRWKDGRYDRLYPAGMTDRKKGVYSALQKGTARKVLEALAESDGQGMTNGSLSQRLQISRSTVSDCVRELSKAGVLTRSFSPDGRILYEIKDPEQLSQLLATFEKGILRVATAAYIDLWDFQASDTPADRDGESGRTDDHGGTTST